MYSRSTHYPLPTPRYRKGQGMVETIVAFSILITGIVTLMSLVVAGSTGRQSNEFQTVAANLAREGVEAVVQKRNNNWINGLAFDTGMYNGTDYTFNAIFDPSLLTWTLGSGTNLIADSTAKIYKYTSGANAGLMVQTAGAQPGSTIASGFSRLLEADPICYDGTTETVITSGTCSGAPGKIGVRVTSLVRWTEKNGNHTISVVETLYDWR